MEAKASKLIADLVNKPVAHAPLENPNNDKELLDVYKEEIDPRIAAEAISICYFHCIMKGLWKAPRIGKGLSVKNIDFMVTPYGCFGRPHQACLEANIPIIMVKENRSCLNDTIPDKVIIVENYLEAMGIISLIKTGISTESIGRPIPETFVEKLFENIEYLN